MNSFLQNIKSKNLEQLSIVELEKVTNEHPYFQVAKSLLLKKYRILEHFKYNSTLKNVAAHTIDREVLFDFIVNTEKEHQSNALENTNLKSLIKEPEEDTIKSLLKEIDKPLEFTSTEKHSFHEWLQLNHPKPIIRNIAPKTEPTSAPLKTKMSTIDSFLLNNPKISRPKENSVADSSIDKSIEDNTNQLMTETLAKVFTTQKKYNDAIQAYKILSLKYPEKSGFFADQIKKIEILQKHKS